MSREGGGEREKPREGDVCVCVYTHKNVCTNGEREREREMCVDVCRCAHKNTCTHVVLVLYFGLYNILFYFEVVVHASIIL